MFNLLLAILFKMTGFAAPSCTCDGAEIPQSFTGADAVFTGEVIKIDLVKEKRQRGREAVIYNARKVTVHATEIFKGKFTADTLVVITSMGNGDCGYEFKLNTQYLFYCYTQTFTINDTTDQKPGNPWVSKKILSTYICSRTTDKVSEERKGLIEYLKTVRQ